MMSSWNVSSVTIHQTRQDDITHRWTWSLADRRSRHTRGPVLRHTNRSGRDFVSVRDESVDELKRTVALELCADSRHILGKPPVAQDHRNPCGDLIPGRTL